MVPRSGYYNLHATNLKTTSFRTGSNYDAVKQVESAKLLPEDDYSLELLSRAVELKAEGKPYSELGRF